MRVPTSIPTLLSALLVLALGPVTARADDPAPAPAAQEPAPPPPDESPLPPLGEPAPAPSTEPARTEPEPPPAPSIEPAKTEPAPAPPTEPAKTEPAKTEPMSAPAAEPAPAPSIEPAKAEPAAGTAAAPKKKGSAAPTPGGLEAGSGSSAFSFDLSLYNSSTLNLVNYNNSFIAFLEPRFAIGKVLLKDTPFSRLTINGRWVLTRTLVGNDPSAVDPQSDLGFAPRCSEIKQAPNGVLDPASVRRCDTNQSLRTTPGDIWVTIANPRLYVIPKLAVNVSPSVRLVIPTSYESRYQTMRLATGGFVNLSRSFESIGVNVSTAMGITKFFHGSTSPTMDMDPAPVGDGPVTAQYRQMQLAPSSSGFYADVSRQGPGRLNPSFSFQNFVSVDWSPTDRLAFSVLYLWLHSFSYDQDQCTVEVGGRPYDTCAAADRVAKSSNGQGTSPGRAVNDLQIFWALAAYQANPWISLQLTWVNVAPQRMEDNSPRQGFISTDYNAFTSVSLGATFSLTQIGAAE